METQDFFELYADASKLAKERNRVLLIIIMADVVFAEERMQGSEDKGAAFEFTCKVSELNDELKKYINSYSETMREQVL